jgi:hypothetical protein
MEHRNTDEWDRIREAGRIAADRRLRAADEAEAGRKLNATPQTLAKRPLRRDAVQGLVDTGRLRSNQQRAALEILEIYTAITREVMARTARWGDGGGVERDWRPSLCRAYRERYMPWRDAMARRQVGRLMQGDLCLAVVVDNNGLRQASALAGVHPDTVLRAVQRALFEYCRIGGWLEQSQVAAEAAHVA